MHTEEFTALFNTSANSPLLAEATAQGDSSDLGVLDQLRNEALVASPVAQIVVTSDGLVALTNRQAESMFGVSTKDVGRPFRAGGVAGRA